MMDIEDIRLYCLQMRMTEESMPFGDTVLVFKVLGKMFVLLSLDESPLTINVKCDPEKAMELREEFDCIIPGYHMNKTYWNTIIIDGSLSKKSIFEHIDHSYQEVVKGMSKKLQQQLKDEY